MNRVEFFQSIKNNITGTGDIITLFFDQYMILYDLIDNVDDICVLGVDESSISFQLYFENKNTINTIVEKIKMQSVFIMYEKCYSISYSNITDNGIDIKISLM